MLVTFFVITLLTFLLGRFSGRIWYRLSAKRANPTDSKDTLVQCPNCLTYLSKANALEVKREGMTHSFCGPDCAEAFRKKQTDKSS